MMLTIEVMAMLIILILVIILQLHISNHHTIHLKYIQFYL